MLRLNGMTRKDVQIVEFPYPDDWYDNPEMMGPPMENPSELWLKRDHKHDLAFRPLETALEKGVIDAMYMQTGPLQQLSEATGKFKAIEDLSRYPDWTLQVANIPAAITCTDVMAEKHPELVVTFMKGMIKVGRWANEHKHAAAAILDKQTFYLDVEHTYRGIEHIDMVPNLSPAEPGLRRDRQGLHAEPRLHQERLRREEVGRAGVPRAGGEGTARGTVEEGDHGEASRDDRAAGVHAAARVVARKRSSRRSRAPRTIRCSPGDDRLGTIPRRATAARQGMDIERKQRGRE